MSRQLWDGLVGSAGFAELREVLVPLGLSLLAALVAAVKAGKLAFVHTELPLLRPVLLRLLRAAGVVLRCRPMWQ